MENIYKGAEADLSKEKNKIIKERIKKEYRVKELDERLRKTRTKREAKLMDKARRAGVNVPRIIKVDEKKNIIEMEYINGKTVKEILENTSAKEDEIISEKIGESVLGLHNANIIHNDLTTSNMLLRDDALYIIDFGLGTSSTRIEDKAIDLVVLKKSLKAAHSEKHKNIWAGIMEAYRKSREYKTVNRRINEIEKRARYS